MRPRTPGRRRADVTAPRPPGCRRPGGRPRVEPGGRGHRRPRCYFYPVVLLAQPPPFRFSHSSPAFAISVLTLCLGSPPGLAALPLPAPEAFVSRKGTASWLPGLLPAEPPSAGCAVPKSRPGGARPRCCVRAVLGRPRGPRGPRQAGPGSSAGPDGEERASEPEAGRRAGAHLPRALHLHRRRGRSVCRESGFLQPPLECSEAAPCLPQGAYQKKKITSGDCSKPHNSFGWFGSGTPKVVPQVKFYL